MENKQSAHQRKAKAMKKKPVKVVYISNPMKVKTSVSEFRALVQELTGRDSDLADKFSAESGNIYNCGDHEQRVVSDDDRVMLKGGDSHDLVDVVQEIMPAAEWPWRSDDSFSVEGFEDVFSSQMLENFDGFFPSSLFFEAPHQVLDVHHQKT